MSEIHYDDPDTPVDPIATTVSRPRTRNVSPRMTQRKTGRGTSLVKGLVLTAAGAIAGGTAWSWWNKRVLKKGEDQPAQPNPGMGGMPAMPAMPMMPMPMPFAMPFQVHQPQQFAPMPQYQPAQPNPPQARPRRAPPREEYDEEDAYEPAPPAPHVDADAALLESFLAGEDD